MTYEDSDHYYAQSEIQRQQMENQQNAYAPQMFDQMQQSQAVLVGETNPKKIVDDIMLRLRGRRKNSTGGEEQISESKMNKVGIEAMWFILESHINQNIILSHLEPEDISRLMDGLQQDLVDDLALNWITYGIQNKTDLDSINNSILMNVFMALKRAEGQNEKNWLGKISLEHINQAPKIPKGKKDGFWSKFRL